MAVIQFFILTLLANIIKVNAENTQLLITSPSENQVINSNLNQQESIQYVTSEPFVTTLTGINGENGNIPLIETSDLKNLQSANSVREESNFNASPQYATSQSFASPSTNSNQEMSQFSQQSNSNTPQSAYSAKEGRNNFYKSPQHVTSQSFTTSSNNFNSNQRTNEFSEYSNSNTPQSAYSVKEGHNNFYGTSQEGTSRSFETSSNKMNGAQSFSQNFQNSPGMSSSSFSYKQPYQSNMQSNTGSSHSNCINEEKGYCSDYYSKCNSCGCDCCQNCGCPCCQCCGSCCQCYPCSMCHDNCHCCCKPCCCHSCCCHGCCCPSCCNYPCCYQKSYYNRPRCVSYFHPYHYHKCYSRNNCYFRTPGNFLRKAPCYYNKYHTFSNCGPYQYRHCNRRVMPIMQQNNNCNKYPQSCYKFATKKCCHHNNVKKMNHYNCHSCIRPCCQLPVHHCCTHTSFRHPHKRSSFYSSHKPAHKFCSCNCNIRDPYKMVYFQRRHNSNYCY